MKCSNCSFVNEPDAQFCENCGQPLERRCPNCGRPASPRARFCRHCGFDLAGAVRMPVEVRLTGVAGADGGPATLHRAAPEALQQKMRLAGARQEGERKLVTALFSDIVGSTALAATMDPEDWRDVVSGAHQQVSQAVYRYEGTIAQLLGDGVLAFFGAPLAHEDDAERAVHAALDIQAAIRDYAARLRQGALVDDLKVRIGLNTGLVVVGSIGSDLHMEYLAIGDTVNLAARMQAAAEPGSVLLTESTQRLVAPLFDLLDCGEVAVKGKAEPVHVYEVQGKRHGAMRLRGVAGLSSPMVAREREFATLMQVAAGVGSGQGGIVSIVGEAGLGKSRLLAEWEEALRRESAPGPGAKAPIRCVAAHCVSYGASVAYYLSSELLRGFIAAPPGASAEETREALWRTCQAQLGSDAEETALSLGHMLGLPMPDQDAAWLKYLDGPALQARYVAGYRRLLGAMVQQAPTLVVVDDLQWADPSSVQLGLELLPLAARLPLVLAFAARPDRESAGWKLVAAAREVPGAGALELHLAPLAEADSRQLLDNLLDKAPLPEPVCALILDRSEGNPFFVEEVLRMLMEHGVFARRDGRWTVVGGVEGLDIPDTLQGVIMARIDRLPEDTKHVLQVASVIGRSFQSRLLDMVLVGETP